MNELLSKISSYNIFNYLFPGAVFSILADRTGVFEIPDTDVVTTLLIYYFVGLTVSRVGSIALEPVLRRARLTSVADYSDYIRACEADTKMEVLVEVANTYRTLAAAFLLFPLLLMGRWGADALSLPANWRYVILIAALAILFLFSVKKQTEYVSKRVNHHCPPQSSGS
jgi:cobalamin synthase